MEPSAEQMVKLYTNMVRSRAFEELVISLVPQGKIPSTWMSGIGQEAIVAAVGQLRRDDYITYTHRGAYCFICCIPHARQPDSDEPSAACEG